MKSEKEYPLQLINAGEDVYQLMSLGHHDFTVFMKAVSEAYPTWPMGRPSHDWMVRAPRKGYRCCYYPCDKNHPKAIPVTSTIESYGEDRWPSRGSEGGE